MFSIFRVPDGSASLPEQVGTKAKFWFDDNQRLFKEGRPGTGENWAEVAAAALAAELRLPHATYRLAIYESRQGVVSETFVPRGARLVLGNELVVRISDRETDQRQARQENHTIGRIAALLNSQIVALPQGWIPPMQYFNACDVMSGYLLLDALIGNQDRHEENWGLVVSRGAVYLAPTFDHASSLGRNETDRMRLLKLESNHPDHGIHAYTSRATTPIYEAGTRLHPVIAFRQLATLAPQRGTYWLEQLSQLSKEKIEETFSLIPSDWISEPAKNFAISLVCENRQRLLALT